MLLTATTVKDSVDNVDRFVRRNLHAGVDHMVVFLDAEQPELLEHFRGAPHVTCVAAWGPWWGGRRPEGLNARQNSNASVANAVLTVFDWATWLFHVDADEVVRVDRPRLEELDTSVRVVRLEVLEAVSHEDVAAVGSFKRLLSKEDRALLHVLGLVDGPRNTDYFHGHVTGKSGWRPDLALAAGVHKPRDGAGEPVDGLTADWLQLLHLESFSIEEFARKWRNLAGSGTAGLTVRGERRALAESVAALLARDLPEAVVDRCLHRLWRRTTRDPFHELRDLGLLEHVDPDVPRYAPRVVPPADLARMRALLASAPQVGPRALHGEGRRAALADLVRAVGGTVPGGGAR